MIICPWCGTNYLTFQSNCKNCGGRLEATHGQIVEVQEDYSVLINGRHPWSIRYQFEMNGQNLEGKVTTLNPVGDKLQEGKAVCILYLPTAPQWNSIYPHP